MCVDECDYAESIIGRQCIALVLQGMQSRGRCHLAEAERKTGQSRRRSQQSEAGTAFHENWVEERMENIKNLSKESVKQEMESMQKQIDSIGSVLGPILFLLYVNDLPGMVESSVKMFADDTKLWRPIATNDDKSKLQLDLSNLDNWSEKWLLKFNAAKCHVMNIGKKSNGENESTWNWTETCTKAFH